MESRNEIASDIIRIAEKAQKIENLTIELLSRRLCIDPQFRATIEKRIERVQYSTLLRWRRKLQEYIENPNAVFTRRSDAGKPHRIESFSEKRIKTIRDYSTSEMIDEMKRRGDWKEVEVSTDKELADELRKRGYEVTAIKKTIIEL